MGRPIDNKEFKSAYYKQKVATYERCLWHSTNCQGKPIRAHSVQNSKVLDLIAEDGHVTMLSHEIREEGVLLDFKRIGRNNATTFTGLCSEHDTLVFKPIDNNDIDPSNPEHAFLVAYRSVFKEFHANLQSASRVQSVFLKGVELGEVEEDGAAAMNATVLLMQAYMFHQTVEAYHAAYLGQLWHALTFECIEVDTSLPPIAGSGVFMPYEAEKCAGRDTPPMLAFNFFPQDGKLLLMFAWRTDLGPDVAACMREAIDPIRLAVGEHRLYLLSKFVLKYMENFVLRPSIGSSFTAEQIDTMQRYYAENGIYQRNEWDDPRLYLFGRVA